jgi:ABC-2 type transport system ATP-binding protein
MAGILTPAGGSVHIAGMALPGSAVSVKEKIGYVPEAAGFFESLSGQEFLELCGRLHGIHEDTLQARIRELLARFGLSGSGFRRLDGYSKGMRQKILLAAALIHNPPLLLMDEPLSGLDVNAALMVKDLIAALAAQGKTIVYSSHVLDVVEKLCDRVLILHEGNLIADASVEDLKQRTHRSTLEDAFRLLTHNDTSESRLETLFEGIRS